MSQNAHISVRNMVMAYGDFIVMKNLNFDIPHESVFVIMGGSGCGKSTLLKHLIGLKEPTDGSIIYDGVNFTGADPEVRQAMLQRVGVLYQGGALWTSMTVGENVALPLELYSTLDEGEIKELVSLKLSLVGLKGFDNYYPSELSGGMRKRAGLARAMALDPDILFFDEPSAGLDPVSSKRLDDLILHIRDSLGTTVVIVTHELSSIFAIGDNGIFLDAETREPIAHGHPKDLLKNSKEPNVQHFLRREL